jgi:hypothetical protein
MERGFEELKAGLEAQLESNAQEQDIFRRLAQSIRAVIGAMEDLVKDGNLVVQYYFEEATQILYNKDRFPVLLSKLILFRKCFELEKSLQHLTAEKAKGFCEKEQETMLQFFTAHRDFQEYYYCGQTTEDRYWYTSLNKNLVPLPYSDSVPPPFNHPGCQLKSLLMAYQEYRPILSGKLGSLSEATLNISKSGQIVKWESTEIDMVELLVALYEAGTVSVDGQSAGQEFLFQQAGSIFSNIDPYKLHGLVKNVRNRKGGAPKFLLRLIAALDARMSRAFTEQPRRNPLKSNRLK